MVKKKKSVNINFEKVEIKIEVNIDAKPKKGKLLTSLEVASLSTTIANAIREWFK
ncbi:hypothetical protein [Lactobacillus mulieris]|uniref:Uncharacterized protein n=1 Tax=Lactobacillus mulieris TaxID=2508708 RepID=A0AAP3GV87_9LACO|nr:hypothetical protein [Lactobacillus mulieris]MCW8123440.1 hypothetical protein [Lactobacillus mulieris]MCZ3844150.1 hypothetical protein [Lactobacillus mulieris]MCZ3875810.1 hypothetical protein [Lactobacillus mulieris]MDK7326603.1 hypothetical protein [Lactobacillus mulieris]